MPYAGNPRRTSPGLRLTVIATVLLGSFVFANYWNSAPPPAPAVDPLPQSAYVRERRWTEAVREAVRRAGGGAADTGQPAGDASYASGLNVLCAEIAPAARNPPTDGGGDNNAPGVADLAIARPPGLDWASLAGSSRPVGLTVRVRGLPVNGEVSPAREPFPTLRRTLEETFAQTAAAGLHPGDVQLDFDCPVPQLRGYAATLEALRAAFPGQTFYPVAQPAWLASPDFLPLARAAGGYVLQVHDLEHPAGPERRPFASLCEPQAADDAVRSAARLGVPFRVALPATGLRLTLDAEGRLVSTATEMPSAFERVRPPAGGSERTLLPDPGDMARLVAEWSLRRPANLRGILWDRLPVPGEQRRLDWPAPTFAAVRAGRVPLGRLQWEFPVPAEGSDRRELALRNVGDADATLPPLLTVSCPEVPLAVEPAGPYEVATPAPKEHRAPRDVRFRLRGTPGAVGSSMPSFPSSTAAAPTPPAPPRRTLSPGATLLFGSVRLPTPADSAAPGADELGAEMEPPPAVSPAETPRR